MVTDSKIKAKRMDTQTYDLGLAYYLALDRQTYRMI